MAKSIVILSDISGATGAKTRDFSIGADAYEVDLTDEEFSNLQGAVSAYIEAGRKVRRGSTSAQADKSSSARRSKSDVAAIKVWGANHGYQVSDRGRLSFALVEAYERATDK
jgi:hypothetical protein